MYGITNSGKLFDNDFIYWLIEAGFIQSQWYMSKYSKYAPNGANIYVIYYVDYCVYWYIYEALVKCFVGTIGNILHVNFLECSHWFVSIRISHMKYHPVSVYQDRYASYIVDKYLDTAIVKTSTRFLNTTFPSGVILTKDDAYTRDEQF